MTDVERFTRWGNAIMTIHASVEVAVLLRKIYRKTVKIVNANPYTHQESAFWDWMEVAHAVRRGRPHGRGDCPRGRIEVLERASHGPE
jgi:cytochrome b561